MDPKAFAFPATMTPLCRDAQDVPFGLTKRELFAAMAMQGILSNSCYDAPRREKLGLMAKDAVSAADALLAELAK